MRRNSEIVREKRGNREKRSFFPGCDGNGEGSRFSRREKKRQASMERLRYVLFCRNGEKAVDGGTGICYTIIWYFTVLVWLSWQSSSLVMSRSPVRIRPQAPKEEAKKDIGQKSPVFSRLPRPVDQRIYGPHFFDISILDLRSGGTQTRILNEESATCFWPGSWMQDPGFSIL